MSGLPRLPRADEAVIPTDKLVGYALSTEHPRGRHKARVFASALAIHQADWRYLHEQLLAGVVEAPVAGRGSRRSECCMKSSSLSMGSMAPTYPVATIWLVAGDRPPRLVSTWVESRERLPQSVLMPVPRHSVLDVVELLTGSGRWPAGSVGTVVEADDSVALVELDDDRGHGLDFVSLPHDALASTGERASRAAS